MKRLRVLHCPEDVGGQTSMLAAAERALGVESVSVAFEESRYGYRQDRVLRRRGDGRLTFERRRLALLLEAARRFDVIHYTFGRSIVPGRPFGLWDVPLLRALGRGIVVTFQGDDVRRGEVALRLFEISSAHECPELYTPELDRARLRTTRIFDRWADTIFYLNPDLAHVLPARSRFLPYASVDLETWKPAVRAGRTRPLVVHAPSDARMKGTRFVVAAVERLAAEGLEFDFRLVEKVQRSDVRAAYEQADIVVDQLLAGWYGGAAVEAMALAKPVVAFIRDGDLGVVPAELVAELPIVRTTHDSVESTLRRLVLASPEERRELGRRSRTFVERWHDPGAVARRTIGAYEDAVRASGRRRRLS